MKNKTKAFERFFGYQSFPGCHVADMQFRKAPIKVLNLCSEKKLVAYTTGINIANITYFIQKATKDNVKELLFSILQYVEVIDLQKEDFLRALNYGFKDIEDAYQCVAAEKTSTMEFILT